jgi:hypothetical protein
MTLETTGINVLKGSSDECRAAFALRTYRYDSGAMFASSSVGDGLVAHLIDLPTIGRPCDTRRTNFGFARPSDLIQKAVRCSSPESRGQFSNGLRLFESLVGLSQQLSSRNNFEYV